MTTKRSFVWGVVLASLLAIASCGGGGGGDDSPPPAPLDTRKPVVTSVRAKTVAGADIDLMTPGATNIPHQAYLVAEIDEVTAGCPTATPVQGTFGDITGAFACFAGPTGATSVWTVVPSAPLADGARYNLTFAPRDAAGNQGELRTSFQVAFLPATVTLTATPASLTAGESATLTWATQKAVNCVGSGGLTGTLAATGGTLTVSPTATTTYGIECRNGANVSTGVVTTTVTVTSKPAKLEYTDVVIALRGFAPLVVYGVNRQGFVSIKNSTGWQFYHVGIRPTPRSDCLLEMAALDNTTFEERLLLLNPKTMEVTRDTNPNRPAWNLFRDYLYTSPLDLTNHPTWVVFTRVADGWYYSPATGVPQTSGVNVWFVDNAGSATQLSDTAFNASGKIDGLWSFTCKAQ